MIAINDKQNCCGCAACANRCPNGCISMRADEEGFLYPQVDKSACTNCGLCEKVCPVLHKPSTHSVLEAYAAKHKDINVKLKSSSGGVFSALATKIMTEGGSVFGAVFNEQWEIVHTGISQLKELDKLRRSKYVQSDTRKTYQAAKNFLAQGRPVLFTGTPCQIAGLRSYLGKEYENLFTAEIICHAVPSPSVWQKFLHENLDVPALQAVNFREKQIGWRNFYLSFLLPHGLNAHGNKKRLSERLLFHCKAAAAAAIYHNSFLKGFLQELINRPSCHACHFKGTQQRLADFTLGDLWGPWPGIIKTEDKKYGMSAIFINTPKGLSFFEKIKPFLQVHPVLADRVALYNAALDKSTRPHPKRTEFFRRYRTEPVAPLITQLLGEKPLIIHLGELVVYKLARAVKACIKK